MMGGAVSSGESNDDLIDNLKTADYITTPLVEKVFRAVDRAFYYTNKQNAYKDTAWRDGNLHISAPCIYSEVMENLQLTPGMSFLNIGSGTGYLSTMAGLIIGHHGSNHGIELHEDVVEYARERLQVFLKSSSAVDIFDFCEPRFVVGNCFDTFSSPRRYDRIYCGAACETSELEMIIDLLKLGGVCIVPINDSLVKMTRVSESRVEMKNLLPVSFTTLVPSKNAGKKTVALPDFNPPQLAELCRAEIRGILRQSLTGKFSNVTVNGTEIADEGRKKRRKRRNDRRRANRLLLVQNRRNRNAEGHNLNGIIAYTCSTSSQDSSDDHDDNRRVRSRTRGRRIYENVSRNQSDPSKSQNGPSTEQTEAVSSTSNVENMDSAPSGESAAATPGEAVAGDQGNITSNGVPPSDCNSRQTMILGRIRDFIRNRQMERKALLAAQAQRANQLLLEVEEALKEPQEGEPGQGADAVAVETNGPHEGMGPDGEDDLDHECVWDSDSSSTSTTTTTSTTSSDSDDDLDTCMAEPEQEEEKNSTEPTESTNPVPVNMEAISAAAAPATIEIENENLGETEEVSNLRPLLSPSVLGISFTNVRAKRSLNLKEDDDESSDHPREMESDSEVNNPRPRVHPFSVEMVEKINLLPLAPALKKYLNYRRQM